MVFYKVDIVDIGTYQNLVKRRGNVTHPHLKLAFMETTDIPNTIELTGSC